MNNYIFNIGLNNNPFSAKEIQEQLEKQFGATDFHVVDSEWHGKSEPILVFTLQADGWAWVNLLAESLCLRYKQTAIAFKGMESGYGTLTYVPGWEGERYEFNDEYFVDYDEQDNQHLVDEVIEEIKRDIASGDLTALDEMLKFIPIDVLKGYLPE